MSDYEIVLNESDIDELMEHGHIKIMADGMCICISLNEKDFEDIESIKDYLKWKNLRINELLERNHMLMEYHRKHCDEDAFQKKEIERLKQELKNSISNRKDALDEVAKLREENKRLQFVCEGHANAIRRLLEVDWEKSYHALSERVGELKDENDNLNRKLEASEDAVEYYRQEHSKLCEVYSKRAERVGELERKIKELTESKEEILAESTISWRRLYCELEFKYDDLKEENRKLRNFISNHDESMREIAKENRILKDEHKMLQRKLLEFGIYSTDIEFVIYRHRGK